MSITVNQITTNIPISSCEIWTDLTDNNGLVTFSHARAIVYYIYALKMETDGAWLYTGETSQIVLN